MRKAASFVAALLLCVLIPSPAFAWGAVAHRYIMRRSIELLPPQIKPFFERFEDELILRSNDPDLWRVAGFDEEVPNHQLDFGVSDYGPYPFTALPREYGAAIEKFGVATVRRHGTLPWRLEEQFGNLRRTMAGFGTGFPYAGGNTVLFTAVLNHYLGDATEPFHLYNNYDGQLTGQNGVHSRFESELFERSGSRLTIDPAPPKLVPDVDAFIWDLLLASYKGNEPVLAADKEAIAGRTTYDDEYFEAFFGRVKPILERQIGAAITATASLIVTAWEQAGRPVLKTDVTRQVQKVRPPR